MSNIDLVKRGLQAFCAGDTATLDLLTTEDFVFSGATPQPVGKAEFLGLCQANHAAFSDFSFNASDFQEDGDVVNVQHGHYRHPYRTSGADSRRSRRSSHWQAHPDP